MMKLAFCLFKYFPYGGLQRDFMRIARACRERGHDIHVYTMCWDAELSEEFHVHVLEPEGWQNHTRCRYFIQNLKIQLESMQFDVVIGFNKMPYLDLYYAADVCYKARAHQQRSIWYRWLPRYRHWTKWENAVFACGVKTKIMLISKMQEAEYQHYYQTETERFHLLPPGIAKDRMAPPNAADIRKSVRATYHIPDYHFLLLMVGSGFKTKGLDRTIRGIASLPMTLQSRCHLIVIGQDDSRTFIKLAQRLRVEKRIQFLGGRLDVPNFLLAADLLLHPSYHENTGTVLLEALASGLPVLTVAACGYADYISAANAGKVLAAPFQQAEWDAALKMMLLSPDRKKWCQNGLAFAQSADIYNLPEKAVDLIELVGSQREPISA